MTARLTARLTTRLPPDVPELQQVLAAVKLVLREELALDSKKVRDIPAGTRLEVLEEVTIDGVVRARVGEDSTPRGLCVHSLGWVTAFKDGEQKLVPKHSAQSESLASRIAARRRKGSAARLQSKLATAQQPAAPAPAGPSWDTSESFADRGDESALAPVAAFEPGREPLAAQSRAAAAAAAAAAQLPPFEFVSSAALVQRVAELTKQAEDVAGRNFDTVASKLGRIMKEKKVNLEALMKEWDRNNDGDISKQE
jgi:hypothetical protein